MCLYLDIDIHEDNNLLEAKIADKDIVCYKIVTKLEPTKMRSLAFCFVYHLNQLYIADIFESAIDLNVSPRRNSIDFGFHSYKKRPISPFHHTVMCIIPKGSLYWLGLSNGINDGYVSNQIIIKKFLSSPISTE